MVSVLMRRLLPIAVLEGAVMGDGDGVDGEAIAYCCVVNIILH